MRLPFNLFLLFVFLAGCTQAAIPVVDTPTPQPTASATPGSKRTLVLPTPVPTLTYTPNPRITPSLTPTMVYTSTPRATQSFTYLRTVPLTQDAQTYRRYEIVIETDGQAGNPFDLQQIDLRAVLTSTGGQRIEVPAFYYQEYDRQTLEPVGEPEWRARFAPPAAGRWQVEASLAQTGLKSDPVTFEVLEDPQARGFVRINAKNPTYFQYDDGSFYFPVGLNVGWSVGDVLAEYERWLDRFSANGGNLVRIWMASWSFGLEWIDTGLGDYTARMKQAWLLDQVFNMAEERGVTIMLCLINHGMFSATTNPQWHENPYNAVLNGPLSAPEEFVSDLTARELFKRRLHYTVARWSYSTSLFAWEWWNEIHWTPITTEMLRPWVTELTAYLRALDPYQHLVTHSTRNSDPIWNAPELQIVQSHDYSNSFLPSALKSIYQEFQKVAPSKPLLLGEFGTDAAGEEELFANQPIHLHNGLWAAPFRGYAGTGMYWWWDNYIDPNDLWPAFRPVSDFFAGEDLAQMALGDAKVSEPRVTALTLQTDRRVLLWVINNGYNVVEARKTYNDAVRNQKLDLSPGEWIYEPKPVENLVVTVEGLRDGKFIAYIFDPHNGGWDGGQFVESSAGRLVLTFRSLETDVAVKILDGREPRPGAP